jgi:hypothetical protein
MTDSAGPQLYVNYAPELDLSVGCVEVVRCVGVSVDVYPFEVRCRFRHPTGYFEYSANDLYFELEMFSHFVRDLRDIGRGIASSASLKDMGQIFVLQLDHEQRKPSPLGHPGRAI